MTQPVPSADRPSLLLIEGGLTLILIACAAVAPRLGVTLLAKPAFWFSQLARRRTVSICLVGFGALLLRLLILPFVPVPQPFITDDFSFLLAADTYASGHLTNPPHPMWTHLESFQIEFLPTYMSMYFPAQGLFLAAGKVVAGHPWFGVLASCSLMCAAICWMLYGWLPPRWALLGGVFAVIRLALFSYWGNTYTGGAVAALGGALVLGALPRLRRNLTLRNLFWLALGMSLLALSRPYEGLLVCVPALGAVCLWAVRSPLAAKVILRRSVPALLLLVFTVGFLAYYDKAVFGSVTTPPYAVNRATYAVAPHFIWQEPRPVPVYRHQAIRDFYMHWELDWYQKSRSLAGLIGMHFRKFYWAESFFFGFALLFPLFLLPRALRDRRIRVISLFTLFFLIGLLAETWLHPHYLAPFTAGMYLLLLQCMRHLAFWRLNGRPSGLFLVRAIPALCVLLAVVRLFAQPLNLYLTPDTFSTRGWFGTRPLGLDRAAVQRKLAAEPGKQLALVRYGPGHNEVVDWVYNAPNIDRSPVVWARDMSPSQNEELLRYYSDRTVWLVEPDFQPPRVTRYHVSSSPVLAPGPAVLNAGLTTK